MVLLETLSPEERAVFLLRDKHRSLAASSRRFAMETSAR